MRASTLFVATVLTAVGISTDARSWGQDAHVAVCEIAFQELRGRAREEVRRLIRTDDDFQFFAHSCTWADERTQRRARSSEHYVNVPREARQIDPSDPCPLASKCAISAIEHDLRILSDPDASDDDRLAALKYLGHWVGDIHQPLHVSFRDDLGGNNIKESGPCQYSLHSIWDTCIFREQFGDDPFEAAEDLREEISDADRANWITSGPVDWANESLTVTRSKSVGYCVLVNGECWYEEDNKELEGDEPHKTVVVRRDYLAEHSVIVADRIQRAGVRLGHLINTAFGE